MQASGFHRVLFTVCAAWLLGALASCSSGEKLEFAHENHGSKRMSGTMKDGVKHGRWITVVDDLYREVEHWHEGVLHGPSQRWYEDGMYSDGTYHGGVLHGRHRVFFEPGQIAVLQWYEQGRRERTWCSWNPDGSLEYIRDYLFDRLLSEDREPAGECPVVLGPGARHLDPQDLDFR